MCNLAAKSAGRCVRFRRTTTCLRTCRAVPGLDESRRSGFRDLGRLCGLAHPTCPYAAVRHRTLPFYGINFIRKSRTRLAHDLGIFSPRRASAAAPGDWAISPDRRSSGFAARWDGRVICGLSGGVDSAVVAALLSQAVGRCRASGRQWLAAQGEAIGDPQFTHHSDRSAWSAETNFCRPGRGHQSARKRPAHRTRLHRLLLRGSHAHQDAHFLAQGTLYRTSSRAAGRGRPAAT